MLKYCNACKRDFENDNFYSYKKSICEQCVNKKVKCDFCEKEFNSTNISKHKKQVHSTSKKTNKNNSTSEITFSDRLYFSTFTDSLKTKHISYDRKI